MVVLRHLSAWGLCCWFVLGSGVSLAAENMSFKGTLIEQGPCKLTGDSKLEINFGDIQVDEIDGVKFSQQAYFRWDCEATLNNTLMIRHLGIAASFDRAAVQTNIADFAIHTDLITGMSGDIPFVVGEAFPVTEKHWGEPGRCSRT